MVTYEEFKEIIRDRAEMEIGARAVIKKVYKTNGNTYDGLVMMLLGINISPVIYLQRYYEMYKDIMDEENAMDSIWDSIKDVYFDSQPLVNVNVESCFAYENIKSSLGLKLVSYERNKDWLEDIVHIPFLDLAIVFVIHIKTAEKIVGTVTITKQHQAGWGKSREELFHDAMESVRHDYEITHVGKIIEEYRDIIGVDEMAESDFPMFVLKNRVVPFGASAILYPHVLGNFADECGWEKIIILPSSLHEVFLLPYTGHEDFDSLNRLVNDINQADFMEELVLSDHIYIYDRKQDTIISG
jgi:hypothetical protein